MLRGMPRVLPRTLDNLNRGMLSFGLSDDTIDALVRTQERRTGRTIRAAFTMTTLIAGVLALPVTGIPIAFWGLNIVAIGMWVLSGLGMLSLLRRGGLL